MYGMIQSDDEGTTVFGIEGHGERIEGLSDDRIAVEALIELCNQNDLAPWQLQDIAEDFVQQAAMIED